MEDKQKLSVNANQLCTEINEAFADLLRNLANGSARGCNQSARTIAQHFENFASTCRDVASLLDSPQEQLTLLKAAESLVYEGKLTLQEIQHVMERGESYLDNVQKVSIISAE